MLRLINLVKYQLLSFFDVLPLPPAGTFRPKITVSIRPESPSSNPPPPQRHALPLKETNQPGSQRPPEDSTAEHPHLPAVLEGLAHMDHSSNHHTVWSGGESFPSKPSQPSRPVWQTVRVAAWDVLLGSHQRISGRERRGR